MFYPAAAKQLRHDVELLLAAAAAKSHPGLAPKVLIAPHAGYIYSGPVAASAYILLKSLREQIQRVVLLGPAHRVAVRGVATSCADFFETPLGRIPIDQTAIAELLKQPFVQASDRAHAQEHGLEVHLPFLQTVLPNPFTLVPLIVGECSPEQVAQLLEILWGGPETLIIISSDLSHYESYDQAVRHDAQTCHAIEKLDFQTLHHDDACGYYPVRGLLTLAKARGMSVKTLDLRNSGDTAGSRDQVVGYGAWAFYESKR